MDLSEVKNKQKRENLFQKHKQLKSKAKLQRRQKRAQAEQAGEEVVRGTPRTIENTAVPNVAKVDIEDEEAQIEESVDNFSEYFGDEKKEPKILITTGRRPSKAVYRFADELIDVFPGSEFIKRGSTHDVKGIVEGAIERDYTDIILVTENSKVPDSMTFIHLPNGPTFTFKVTSIQHSKEIHNHGRSTCHIPELILNNFSSRIGLTVSRLFTALFPHVPEFEGRQVVTFHDQRDFIFVRRHRYIFKDGKRVHLQEIGPRFTLKLRSVQKGTFDTKHGEYEFIHKPEMDVNRKQFYL